MGKKKITKKNFRKPKVGDTVFIKGESRYRAWYYKEKIIIDDKEFAHCTLTLPKLDDTYEILEENFPINILTLEPPPQPTSILLM